MSRRIAIVEDDAAIRENYADVLRRQGYEVAAYPDRPAAMQAFRTRLPDLAVVDIGLGDEIDGGFALCRELRALSATLPIIFLTARDSEFDTVSGLRLGADDYLTKDVSLPHLLARIAALFRRVDALGHEPAAEDVIERGKLRLDMKRVSAAWNGRPVELTVTELWIVHALARHPGHVKNREQLMGEARMVVDDSTVTSHVKRIRKKLVRLSITVPWSNGPIEGQINRLKVIKRQMYGRAGFDLLKVRVMPFVESSALATVSTESA